MFIFIFCDSVYLEGAENSFCFVVLGIKPEPRAKQITNPKCMRKHAMLSPGLEDSLLSCLFSHG